MKRVLSLVMCVLMLFSTVGVSADSASASDMEAVLLIVKSRIVVPENLTEFGSGVNVNGDKTGYQFFWSDKDGGKTLEVSCDDKGRIGSYYYYGNNYSKKKISSVTKQEILDFCEEFLKKTLPEAYSADGTDVLEADMSTYNANGNLRYSVSFLRKKNGVEVRGNSVRLTVYVSEDKLYVSNMSAYIDYETEFTKESYSDFDYTNVYMEKFPSELIYRNDYTLYRGEGPDRRTKLVYRIKDNLIGYIRATDSSVAEPDSDAGDYRFMAENSMMADTAAGGASAEKNMLSEAEISELAVVEELLSVEEIKDILAELPYVDFDTKLDLAGVSLNKNEDNEYFYRVNFNNSKDIKAQQYRYVNAVVNAHNGEVTYISNSGSYNDSDKELTDAQKSDADRKIDEFLNAVVKDKLGDVRTEPVEYNYENVYRRYTRIVNGVRYIDNGISVSFDGMNGKVRSYSLNMDNKDFEDAEKAISPNMAYKIILDYAPVKEIYIKCDGAFVKCYTLSKNSVELDAVNGEILNPDYENSDYRYSDIENHWSREAAEKLAEIQIGIKGDKFEPDKKMTQYELLRFLSGGMMNKYYLDMTKDELYENLLHSDVITEEEKNPDGYVTREDAFVYMIRIAGLEKVAKLEDIYKVSYTDGHLISEGKLGYAAILSGMRIINGSGGAVRPLDNITRAEAATMIYKYLLTF